MNKRICVIGAGRWGSNHIRTLNELDSLAGIVDSDDFNIDKISKQYSKINIHNNLEDSFLHNYDGYIVATPAISHFDIAKKIINNNNNVLIEKPMTLNAEDAKELVDISANKDSVVMVGHLLLFHPAIIKIKELIDSGKIGKLQYIYSNRLNLGQIRTEENVFWSLAPHDISILQYFIGAYPENINCSGAAFVQDGIHDTTITNLIYPENIKAHIYLSWIHPFKEHRLVIIGSDGMLTFEDSSIDKEILFYDKKFVLNHKIPEKRDGDIEKIDYNRSQPLKEELIYFMDNLENKNILKSSVQDGYEIVKILDSASNDLQSKTRIL